MRQLCDFPGCGRPLQAEGLCKAHVMQRRAGRQLQPIRRKRDGMPPRQRLLDQTTKTPTCWLWTGCKNNSGYGAMTVEGRRLGAHVVSYLIHRGEVPPGMHVCHRCDVPACVNPDHLFLANRIDNMADMKAKRRSAGGQKNGQARLTEADVRAIRLDTRPGRIIATDYGCSDSMIFAIRKRKRWSHLL